MNAIFGYNMYELTKVYIVPAAVIEIDTVSTVISRRHEIIGYPTGYV